MKVKLGDQEINLDKDILKFSEATINEFLSKYASLYDDYQQHHADAAYLHSMIEDRYDALVAAKVVKFKTEGGSDALSKARATADEDVQKMLEQVRIAEHVKDSIWAYLRSMDKAHTNALQLCYNLRKELDKLFPQSIAGLGRRNDVGLSRVVEQKLEDIIGKIGD